jgi:hypothetical protein
MSVNHYCCHRSGHDRLTSNARTMSASDNSKWYWGRHVRTCHPHIDQPQRCAGYPARTGDSCARSDRPAQQRRLRREFCRRAAKGHPPLSSSPRDVRCHDVLPTITIPLGALSTAAARIAEAGAVGLHLEGPFLAVGKARAATPSYGHRVLYGPIFLTRMNMVPNLTTARPPRRIALSQGLIRLSIVQLRPI